MNSRDLYQIVLPAAGFVCLIFGIFMLGEKKRRRREQRIARVTSRRTSGLKSADSLKLRKTKESSLPVISKILQSISVMATLRARLERAGLVKITPDIYVTGCAVTALLSGAVLLILHKPPALALLAAMFAGGLLPYFIVGYMGAKRIKNFLKLFPDAIDFIVRGLRSGLPATESMNMVGTEMEEPIGSIFAGIGESVRLGVSVEKALTDTAKKLKSTEFNFFVTSIVLQRETGGNLSEILSNLAEVLRKRFMMRMKIKAMSSEAKASAIIVGSLPFVVILALTFVSPGYLDPLFFDPRGHKWAAGAATSLLLGIGIMVKMTRFEI